MKSEHLNNDAQPDRYLEPKLANELSATTKDLIIAANRAGNLHIWEPEIHSANTPKVKHLGVFFNRRDDFTEAYVPSTLVRVLTVETGEFTEISNINVQTDFGQGQECKYQFNISDEGVDVGVYYWEGGQNRYESIEGCDDRQELLGNLQNELDYLLALPDNKTGIFNQPKPESDPL